jgi:hypothetical protein
MKDQKTAAPGDSTPAEPAPRDTNPGTPASKPDHGLSERRKMIRTLPVPDAIESERDTDWALFQSLSDAQETPKK